MKNLNNPETREVFIEVASGEWAWTDKLKKGADKRGLKAPARTRYFNMFKCVGPGDIVLTHLTLSLTRKKEWQSAIVGISTITSEYYTKGNMIFLETDNDTQVPIPIKFSDYKGLNIFSEEFSRAIQMSMQKYLIRITREDLRILLGVHPENMDFLKKNEAFRDLIAE